MSRSLSIQFQYRNNKTNSIGMHNPEGYRFRLKDRKHLRNMYNIHIVPHLEQNKFKDEVRIIEHVDGKEICDKKMDIDVMIRFIKSITNDRRVE